MFLNRVFWVGLSVLTLLLGVGCAGRGSSKTATGKVIVTDEQGAFVWQDLITDDVSASQRFYSGLLGWRFEKTTRLGKPYLLVRSGNHLIGGIVTAERKAPDQPIAQWLSYVRVDDLDQVIAKIRKSGGDLLVGPVVMSDAISAAVIRDPQGAILGLIQSPERAPRRPVLPPYSGFF